MMQGEMEMTRYDEETDALRMENDPEDEDDLFDDDDDDFGIDDLDTLENFGDEFDDDDNY